MDSVSNEQKRGDLITASLLFVLMTGRYGWDSQLLMGDFFNSERSIWLDERNARLKSAAVNTAIILLICVLISDKTNGKNMLTGDSWIQLSNKGMDHDDIFLEGLVQIIENLRNIKTSYGIQGPNYTDALLLAQQLENVLLKGVNVFALAVEKLNAEMAYYNDKDNIWVEDEDLEMLKKGLRGEIGNINWLEDNIFDLVILNDEKKAKIRSELKRDGIEHDGGRKKYSLKKFIRNKSRKIVSNKLQIAGGKGELEKKLRELNDTLNKLIEIDRVNPNQWNDESMTYTRREIDKIRFQLKTPEEQQAVIERQKVASSEALQRRKELEAERERNSKKLEAHKLETTQREHASSLRSIDQTFEEERQRVQSWEEQNKLRLKDKTFVRTEYEKLKTQYENITANGQPRGAAGFRGYPIWYKLMVELLHKYL